VLFLIEIGMRQRRHPQWVPTQNRKCSRRQGTALLAIRVAPPIRDGLAIPAVPIRVVPIRVALIPAVPIRVVLIRAVPIRVVLIHNAVLIRRAVQARRACYAVLIRKVRLVIGAILIREERQVRAAGIFGWGACCWSRVRLRCVTRRDPSVSKVFPRWA
jgi:hypothetical protein